MNPYAVTDFWETAKNFMFNNPKLTLAGVEIPTFWLIISGVLIILLILYHKKKYKEFKK